MKGILAIVLVFNSLLASAQIDGFQKAYDDFRKQAKMDYEDFREKANEKYVAFVRKAWVEARTLPAVPKPEDERMPPVIFKEDDKNRPRNDKPVIIDELLDMPDIKPQPMPVSPILENPVPSDIYFSFIFYGTEMRVRANDTMKFKLNEISSNAIAAAWERLSTAEFNNLIHDCLKNRIRFNLSDWAYLRMLDLFCDSFAGNDSNEAELLKAYLYCQSGYQMRLAIANNRLYMLYSSQYSIFEKPCWEIDGMIYYADDLEAERIQICDAGFPNEQALSMQISQEQLLDVRISKSRTITSQDTEWMSVCVSEDENLMDFYCDYPTSCFGNDFMTRWALYANAPLSESAKKQLYPRFKEMFAAMPITYKEKSSDRTDLTQACVDMLCHWVQTGFIYEHDEKLWGHDRAFFPDETLFYPYCDCEDRSILLTRLVRDLLGLKCALIYYPGHLATAIAVGEDVKGDYLRIDGIKYIVCDPTYIGAPIGMTMPGMDNKTAKVIVLK